MSRFTGDLTVKEFHVDSDLWQLLTPLVYEIGKEGSGDEIVIAAGFISDGASIPWPLTAIWPRWGRKYRRPAILHDLMCRSINEGTPLPNVSRRAKADAIFLEAMRVCGVSWPARTLFYLGVSAYTLWRAAMNRLRPTHPER